MAASATNKKQPRLNRELEKASPPALFILLSLVLIFVSSSPRVTLARLSGITLDHLGRCGGQCNDDDECEGMLACIHKQCNDDPQVGSHICSTPIPGPATSPALAPSPISHSGMPSPSPSARGSSCTMIGYLMGTGHSCNTADDSSCCKQGTRYPQYECSPRVTAHTPAMLTLNSFQKGGDGGGPSACDGDYHSDSDPVVALSTGWYDGGSRCLQQIRVFGNGGHSVIATVVDECDSVHGCGPDWDYQPPCHNNIVDASKAVWEALGVSQDSSYYGMMHISWTDA